MHMQSADTLYIYKCLYLVACLTLTETLYQIRFSLVLLKSFSRRALYLDVLFFSQTCLPIHVLKARSCI